MLVVVNDSYIGDSSGQIYKTSSLFDERKVSMVSYIRDLHRSSLMGHFHPGRRAVCLFICLCVCLFTKLVSEGRQGTLILVFLKGCHFIYFLHWPIIGPVLKSGLYISWKWTR